MKLNARVAAVAAVALATAGCSAINPITTQQPYDASDGVSVQVGEVRALNILVITEAEGEAGIVTGSLTNETSEDVTVTVSLDGTEAAEVDVPADSTVQLGGEDGESQVTGTSPAAPGLIAPVAFSTATSGPVVVDAPVLDGTLAEYQGELDSLS